MEATPEQRAAYAALSDPEKDEVASLMDGGMSPAEALRRTVATSRAIKGGATRIDEPALKDKVAAGFMGAANTMAFGLADEARGLGAAIPALMPGGESPVDAYQRGRDAQREATGTAVGISPGATALGETAAAFIPGGKNVQAAVKAVRAGVPQLIKKGATAGAAQGAVGGFGSGEGLADTALRTGGGAAAGAAMGAAAMSPSALKLVRKTPGTPAPSPGLQAPTLIQKAAGAVDAGISKLPKPAQSLVPGVPMLKAAAGALKAKPATTSPVPEMSTATLQAMADDLRPPTLQKKPPVAGPADAIEPTPNMADEADAFDPGGESWRAFAEGTPATPVPRPDLDAAAQVMTTPTRVDRTPAPGPSSPMQAPTLIPKQPDMPADVMAGMPPLQPKPPAPAPQPSAPPPGTPQLQKRPGLTPAAERAIARKDELRVRWDSMPAEQQSAEVSKLVSEGLSLSAISRKLGIPQRELNALVKKAQFSNPLPSSAPQADPQLVAAIKDAGAKRDAGNAGPIREIMDHLTRQGMSIDEQLKLMQAAGVAVQ